MAIPSWKLFPALVCGNTCVIKPAEDTPLSTYNLVQTLIDAGLPPGVVNIVCGFGPVAGAPLVEHPDVRAISFTGSSDVGSLVGQRAAANFKPVSLEMGGKNAQIVLNDANLELALDGALWGAFGTTGQRCTATSRILLQKGIAAEFTAKLVARAKALKVGNGLDEADRSGPAGERAADRNFKEVCRDRRGRRCEAACRWQSRLPAAPTEAALSLSPRFSARLTPTMRIAREEVFGPVVSLIEFDTFEQAIEIANSIDYGLSTALYTKDVNRAFTAIRDLEAGITYINAPTIGAEVHLPFGGVKQHRQRPPRRPGRHRLLHDVEGCVCGLLRQAAARADR